ncbi:hypothetical protein Tco_0732885 [Tanacetum coccineum]
MKRLRLRGAWKKKKARGDRMKRVRLRGAWKKKKKARGDRISRVEESARDLEEEERRIGERLKREAARGLKIEETA